jgi:hypothetical protein
MNPEVLATMAEAARRASDSLGSLSTFAAPASDAALDVVNRQSRTRFVACAGCPDCAEPFPLLAGDVS